MHGRGAGNKRSRRLTRIARPYCRPRCARDTLPPSKTHGNSNPITSIDRLVNSSTAIRFPQCTSLKQLLYTSQPHLHLSVTFSDSSGFSLVAHISQRISITWGTCPRQCGRIGPTPTSLYLSRTAASASSQVSPNLLRSFTYHLYQTLIAHGQNNRNKNYFS